MITNKMIFIIILIAALTIIRVTHADPNPDGIDAIIKPLIERSLTVDEKREIYSKIEKHLQFKNRPREPLNSEHDINIQIIKALGVLRINTPVVREFLTHYLVKFFRLYENAGITVDIFAFGEMEDASYWRMDEKLWDFKFKNEEMIDETVWAILTIGQLELKVPSIIHYLSKGLTIIYWQIRAASANALGLIKPTDPQIHLKLSEMIRTLPIRTYYGPPADEAWLFTIEATLEALKKIKIDGSSKAMKNILSMVHDKNEETRGIAVSVLADLAPNDLFVLDYIINSLQNGNEFERTNAAIALEEFNSQVLRRSMQYKNFEPQ